MPEPLPKPTEPAALPLPADAAKIAELRRIARRLRRQVLFTFVWSGLLGPGVSVLLLPHNWSAGLKGALGALMYMAWLMVNGLYRDRLSSRWRKTMEEIAGHCDVKFISSLIENSNTLGLHREANALLTLMLPRLKATDADLLTAPHHRLLNRALNQKWRSADESHSGLLLAILKAYEQVGNVEDLPTVERLARGEGYARHDKEIKTAAQACLPYLQARSEQQETRQNLLRASQSAADSPATLLRPAAASDELAPRQLLRPVEPEQ